MAKTSASFTLMDYTDGISLITGIDSNLPLTSMYDQESKTLNPSWASTNLKLTPKVFKAGTSTSLVSTMTNKKWYRRIAGGEWTEVTSSSAEAIDTTTGLLTVKEDKLTGSVNQIDYKFTGTYYDSILKLNFPTEVAVTLSRVINGTSFVVARAYCVDGDTFKNGEPSSLTIKAELIRGADSDTTDLTYVWAYSEDGVSWTTLSSATTNTLSIQSKDVNSFRMFRCTIKDTDATSITYNQTFTTEGVSILDLSDPYQAVIESTAGQFFKGDTGSTILICRVYQNGQEVDETGEKYTYTWTKTDQNGNAETISKTGIATGSIVATNKKAISVSNSEVTVKATFFCSVE